MWLISRCISMNAPLSWIHYVLVFVCTYVLYDITTLTYTTFLNPYTQRSQCNKCSIHSRKYSITRKNNYTHVLLLHGWCSTMMEKKEWIHTHKNINTQIYTHTLTLIAQVGLDDVVAPNDGEDRNECTYTFHEYAHIIYKLIKLYTRLLLLHKLAWMML